jgi:hypothetical protein
VLVGNTLECNVGKQHENEAELIEALKMLFDLLEEYAPTWYTEEHHDRAASALGCKRRS